MIRSKVKGIRPSTRKWRKGLAISLIIFIASLIVLPALWPCPTYARAATNVTSQNTDRTYTTGEDIYITVTFSEKVYMSDFLFLPYLELETGTTDRDALYVSGSGTDTLTFRYTVQKGDSSSDLDYRATDSLKLNGGTIKDTAGNDVDLALAAPGETGSLSANKALVIDTESAADYKERFPGIDKESIYITSFSNQLPADIDASDKADTQVRFRYTGIVTGEIMIAKYKEEPASPAIEFSALESEGGTEMEGVKFIDVYVSGFSEGTAIITINYSDDEVSSFKEDSLSLFYWDNSAWQKVENISRHMDTNIILGEVPVSALSGTPIGLGGDEDQGQDQDQDLVHFILFTTIGGIAIMGILTWSLWDHRRRYPKMRW